MSLGDFVSGAVKVVTAPAKAVVNVATSAVNTAEHAASDVGHAFGSALSTATHTAGSVANSVAHGVSSGALGLLHLGLNQGSAIGSALGSTAWNIGKTVGHDASSAFSSIKSGATTFTSELGHTVGNVGSAIGHGATAIGGGFVHTATDVLSTAGKVGGDVVHTVGNVGSNVLHTVGDLAHGQVGAALGDLGNVGKVVISGASQAATDTAHGAANVASDVGHTAAGIGQAAAEGGGALASGLLQMGGTLAGTAGALAKDYEHMMGNVLTNAVDAVGAIAKGEVAFGYGAAGIIAHTVGTPLGDFYANVAKHYGDAAIGTLDHVNKAIDGAVSKATTAGGDIANSLGHGADKLGHDGGQVISDISHGNFSAAARDIAQFGSDLFDAGKQFAGAEKEGVEALAAIGNGITTTLNGLNEAMARAGGGFVSAVGDTIGGHAGHVIADAGDGLGKATAMTAALVQGNYEDAAKEGAKELGGLAGGWVGDQVKHVANDLGDKVGGVFGDGIRAAGGAAADAIKDAGKSLAGAAADKGLDAVKGGDDHAPNADNSDDSQTPGHTASNDSLVDKALNAAEQAKDDAIHKVNDMFDKATHDPQSLLNMAADAIKDHLVKDPGDGLGKLFAANLGGSHAPTGAHASDDATTATSHAALTAQTPEHSSNGFWDDAAHAATPGANIAAALSHLSWGALNPQPLPPGPDPDSISHALQAHGSDAGIFAGVHDAMSALQGALHDQHNWSALNPQPLPPSPADHSAQAIHIDLPAFVSEFTHHLAL